LKLSIINSKPSPFGGDGGGFYHFKIFISSIFTVNLFLKIAIMIANPTAASAAATAITKNTKSCPVASPKYEENVISVRFAELSINSTDIKTTIAFLRVSTPTIPTENINALNIR
jgi:hypothetical protein